MKKIVCLLLAALSVVMFAACTGKPEQTEKQAESHTEAPAVDSGEKQRLQQVLETVCSADEALELAKKSNAVVFETKGCVFGKETWDAFYEKVRKGAPAIVLCANYYTLSREGISDELYEQKKDKYPQLVFNLLEYDGETFVLRWHESTVEYIGNRDTYKYLLHFTGDAPSEAARYTQYDNYVLVNDPTVTWDEIFLSICSSQLGDYIPHHVIYKNYIGWKD